MLHANCCCCCFNSTLRIIPCTEFLVVSEQDVLGLDVPMAIAFAVHERHGTPRMSQAQTQNIRVDIRLVRLIDSAGNGNKLAASVHALGTPVFTGIYSILFASLYTILRS